MSLYLQMAMKTYQLALCILILNFKTRHLILYHRPESSLYIVTPKYGEGYYEKHFSHVTSTYKNVYKVNSYHHQGVSLESLSKNPNLIPLLINKDMEFTFTEGNHYIVEAFMHSELNIIGVQYHPERMVCDDFSNTLIQYLLSKSNKKTNKKLNLLNF